MSYSRRQLYALGEPLGDSVTRKEGGRIIYGDGGGGGGGSTPQTSTTYSTNIPEYARPYVETMLSSGQQQIFNMNDQGQVTGFKPYTPYSTNAQDYVAGFSPMQQQAFGTVANLQVPGQYAAATGLAGAAGMQGLDAGQAASGLQQTALGYGQAGQAYGDVGQMYGAQGAQQAQLAAQRASMQAQRLGQQGVRVGMQGLGYGAQGAGYGAGATALGQDVTQLAQQQGLGYGALGAEYGAGAAGLAPSAQAYGQTAADIGAQGLGYGATGAGYGAGAAGMAGMGYGAGAQFAQQATSPAATAAYMSPYMQNVVDYQKAQAARDYSMANQARKAQAVGAGAFGGSRQAIQQSEADRALMSQLQGIEAQGAQQAFQNAQAQQQFGANLGLQGLQAGTAAQQAGIQGAQAGLAGLGTGIQGQQAALSGLGQAGQLYGLGMQGAGYGLQGLQGALAGSAQGLQGYQTGIQGAQTGISGISPALQGISTGLSGVGQQLSAGQLGLQGTAQGIQGAQAGMQGAGVGLSGVGAATQAGQYGLSGASTALQGAQALGQLGTSELGAQTNIAQLQNQMGAQQQAQQQKVIDQSIQNYATAQQYPYMQLGILNSLLRGLPLQSTTTSSYQATPSTAQQIAGLGVSGLGAYKALSGFKEGGEVKGYASRGLAAVSGGVEGSIRAKLEMMSDQQLMQVAKTSQSAEVRAMAQEVLTEHKIREQAEMRAQQAINQEQAAKPQMPQEAPAGLAAAPAPNMDSMGMATGGIVAFANEGLAEVEEEDPFAGLDEKTRKIAERQMGVQRAFGVKDNIYDPYKQFLTDKAAGLSKEKDYVKGMGLMDLGARIASTPGPWGTALAQSISGALPGFQKGVADYKKQEADVYKAQTDVAKAENDAAMGKANKVGEAYEKLEDRERALEQTKMQVAGNIRAAGISANRETDLDRTTAAILADKIAGGAPDNAATRAAARKDALAATGFTGQKVATAQETAVTTALDKDDTLKQLNDKLGLLSMTPKQAEKNATAIADIQKQIAAREQYIRNRVLRQPQDQAAAPGAGTMRFDAQGNPIS